MGEFVKLLVLAGLAVACFTAPRWVPACCSGLRDGVNVSEFCDGFSGATPDYECHDEAWY